jgi:hypothetical protein
VPPQRAELDVAGVGVRVEVDHRHPPVAEDVRHALGVGEGDRVVAAEDDGDRPGPGHRLDRGLQCGQRGLDVTGVHLDVPGVEDPQVAQPVGAQRQARPGPVVRQVVGHPDRLGAEAGARAVRRPAVEGGAEDDDVRAGEGRRVAEVAAVDAEVGDVGPVLGAVAGHVRRPGVGGAAKPAPGVGLLTSPAPCRRLVNGYSRNTAVIHAKQ